MTSDLKYRQTQEAKLRRVVLAAKRVFATREGKILWLHLQDWCGMQKPVFTHDMNPVRAAIKEGKRLTALYLQTLFKYSPGRDGNLTINTERDE